MLTAGLGGGEGGEGESGARVAPSATTVVPALMVPLDFCFKELKSVNDMVGEEPLASYSGVLPRKVKLPPPADAVGKTAAEEEAEEKEKEKRAAAGKTRGAPEPDEEPAPFRYVVNTVRLNNNLLTSIVGLPTVTNPP